MTIPYQEKYPNLRLMVRERQFYSKDGVHDELVKILADVDRLEQALISLYNWDMLQCDEDENLNLRGTVISDAPWAHTLIWEALHFPHKMPASWRVTRES